jgi:hypothetical protein
VWYISNSSVNLAQLGLKRIPSSTNILQSYEPWVPYDDGKIIPDQSTKVSQCHIIPKLIIIAVISNASRSSEIVTGAYSFNISSLLVGFRANNKVAYFDGETGFWKPS